MSESPRPSLPALLKSRGAAILRNALVAAVVLPAASFLLANQYTASTTLLPPSEGDDLSGMMSGATGSTVLTRAFGLSSQSKTDIYLGVLRSVTLNRALLRKFNLTSVYHQRDPEIAGRALLAHTRIELTNEGFVRVSVTEKNAALAAGLANSYAEELDRFLQQNTNLGARLRREFLERRLAAARDTLTRAENVLRDYQVQHHMPVGGADAVQSSEGAEDLIGQKLTRELELGTLRGISRGRSPRVEQLQAELAQINAEIARIPPAATQLARLMREARVQEKIVLVLAEEHERARFLELKNVAMVEVVDRAEPPMHKSSPKRTLIALGAFLTAACVGTGLYFARGGDRPRA